MPQDGGLAVSKEDPAHTRLCSVNRPNHRRVGDDFSKPCGLSGDALSEQFKVR